MSRSKPVVRKMVDCVVKGKEIFLGLEVSKKTFVVCARSGKEIVHEASMPARYDALKAYLRNNFPDCKVHAVYEAGFSGFGLYDDLAADGYGCTVVPPHTVHQEKCARVKNDRADARLLAKNLEDGNCKECSVPDKERRVDRQVARKLGAVTKSVTRVKNQIRKQLDFHGIETGVKAADWGDNHYRHVKTEILPTLDEELQFVFAMDFEALELYWRQRKALLAELKAISRKGRYARAVAVARSLPGIGWLTAARMILELGEDFGRFKTGAEIASFVGLGGTEHSSGESVKKGGITKQGNPTIRSWLIESAWVAIKKDPAMRQFYSRVRANSGNGKKAIVAVARKLVTRLRSCIVNDTEYVFGVAE